MKFGLVGSAIGAEIGAPQISRSSSPTMPASDVPAWLGDTVPKKVRPKPTGRPLTLSGALARTNSRMSVAYVGESTCGVLLFKAGSGAGNVLPFTCV